MLATRYRMVHERSTLAATAGLLAASTAAGPPELRCIACCGAVLRHQQLRMLTACMCRPGLGGSGAPDHEPALVCSCGNIEGARACLVWMMLTGLHAAALVASCCQGTALQGGHRAAMMAMVGVVRASRSAGLLSAAVLPQQQLLLLRALLLGAPAVVPPDHLLYDLLLRLRGAAQRARSSAR